MRGSYFGAATLRQLGPAIGPALGGIVLAGAGATALFIFMATVGGLSALFIGFSGKQAAQAMNKPSLVLLLGSVRRGEFETLLAHGHRLGVILDEKRRATLPASDGFDFVATHDFSRPVGDLAPILKAAQREFAIVAEINLREFYVRSHAYTADLLRLPGLPQESVDLVLNKTLMRRAFVESLGEGSTPRFCESPASMKQSPSAATSATRSS